MKAKLPNGDVVNAADLADLILKVKAAGYAVVVIKLIPRENVPAVDSSVTVTVVEK